ncbi:hypothetical protein GQ600_27035 [Phytophthora cactorum]|nr:hypothetical protein GQ600_27035 [Phytophthora cactorum]
MYKEFKVDFTEAQAKKVLHGKPVRLTHGQLGKGHVNKFHPENYKKLVKAHTSGKGCTLHMYHGEVLRTHQSGLSGSGLWENLWKGVKSAAKGIGGFLKDNWKPILSGTLDGIATAAGPEVTPLRGLIKDVSGVGLTRRKRRIGASGSFRLN